MSFNEKISYPIGGKQVQGGLPAANQILQFNVITNQWEFVSASVPQTFARAVKTVDEDRSNTIVPVNDAELTMQLGPPPFVYGFLCWIRLLSPIPAGFRYDFNVTGAGSGRIGIGTWSSSVANVERIIETDLTMATNGNTQSILICGEVESGSAPGGIFTFRWAQNVSDPGLTRVSRGSYLIAWESLS